MYQVSCFYHKVHDFFTYLPHYTSRHYCIPIDKAEEVAVEAVCAVRLDVLSKQDQYKTVSKLHRQFAHPTKKRLIAFLKDAGVWKEEYYETVRNRRKM